MNIPSLDIQDYSLDELLGLFELSNTRISTSDIKKAKKQVLMLHPDKSRLEPKFFLFYKKAFDIVVEFYDNQNRHNRTTDATDIVYTPTENTHNESTINSIQESINKKSKTQDFNSQFNDLFENNNLGFTPDASQNDWYINEQSQQEHQVTGTVNSGNMGDTFHTIKQQSTGLIQYNGVQDMNSSSGSSLYGNDPDQYATCDPFGKLQYDDLRKVHRDQSVMSVHESDIHNMKTYNSVDAYKQAQDQHSYDPLAEAESKRILTTREHEMQDRLMRQEYQAKLDVKTNEQKNQNIMASFLKLK
jgi:hypothetical protein|tara:strand:+ start:45 stop:950 length:906 start_codon:yes stop_codon:yes gene_type:complete